MTIWYFFYFFSFFVCRCSSMFLGVIALSDKESCYQDYSLLRSNKSGASLILFFFLNPYICSIRLGLLCRKCISKISPLRIECSMLSPFPPLDAVLC
jgi:hypothetical protein